MLQKVLFFALWYDARVVQGVALKSYGFTVTCRGVLQ